MAYIILAILSGCLVILSMTLNARLAKEIGIFQGTFVNYLVGLIIILLAILITKNINGVFIVDYSKVPYYAFLGGIVGVMVVAASNVVIPKIPTMYTTLLIFIGQLFTGIILDYLTISSVSIGKIIGGLLVVLGIVYNSRLDKE